MNAKIEQRNGQDVVVFSRPRGAGEVTLSLDGLKAFANSARNKQGYDTSFIQKAALTGMSHAGLESVATKLGL